MSIRIGRNLPVSRFRGLVVDLVSFCQKVPGATVDRPMNVSALLAARQACVPRPTWTAILLKAMSIVAAREPELRRTYMPFPWPHLYEHPINIANFTIERHYQGENVVFFVQVRSPQNRSLVELDQIIRTCKEEPVESVKFFKRAIRMSMVPWPFRWVSMWVSLNLFGKLRCHNFGTFSLTSVASEGAGVLALTPLLTSTLHPGLIDEHGVLPMRLTFDHRALDGACVARAMVQLERVLLGEILDELTRLRVHPPLAA
jgi:hypothetical protein